MNQFTKMNQTFQHSKELTLEDILASYGQCDKKVHFCLLQK